MGEGDTQRREWLKCKHSVVYFLHNYGYIYDATQALWVPFHLWKEQATTLKTISIDRLVVILKARQLGLTWLVLGFALWLMLFHPAVTILVFSRRDDEAQYLLDRLRGMYGKLPEWMRVRRILSSNAHIWQLSNGSIAYGFPTTAGDSYTATMAIVDEADLVPNLDALMNAVKPTIDGGGRMILLSRSNKEDPNSTFKRIYRAARAKTNGWTSVFLPWYVRPSRDEAWYEAQRADIESRTGSLDDLYQQYPTIDEEALSARTLDKRIPPNWVYQCFEKMDPLPEGLPDTPSIPGLRIFRLPAFGKDYVVGADPAEGNPTSDDSSLHVLEVNSGEEVANLAGKYEPTTFASYAAEICRFYNKANILPERNNHGHAFIAWMADNAGDITILDGLDGEPGWQTNSKSKAMLYSNGADAFKDKLTTMHDDDTYMQVCSIEGATLKAPKGAYDDRAMSYMLALSAALGEAGMSFAYTYIEEATGKNRRTRNGKN